jgi:DNA polymerase III epsilon subunit family exonuclease
MMPRRKKPPKDAPRLFPERRPGRITIFDLETTGLDVRNGARAVEICAVCMDEGVETARLDTLLNPGVPIPRDAMAVHGITNAMVKGFPSLYDVLPEFIALAEGGALAAYNSSFDMSFMEDAATKQNKILDNPVVDLIPLARKLFPGHSTYALWYVRNILKLEADKLHRAAADVSVCLRLWSHWVEHNRFADHEQAIEQAVQLSTQQTRPNRLILDRLKAVININGFIEILYEGNQGTLWRKVQPQKVCNENGTLVLKAFCFLRSAERTFAAYRIRDIREPEGG